ncbi:ATP-binding protein [Xenorhabdus bovienii]|uniref:AAA family ATPase n=1 Tax=Xenorhabdus bovienii TaxID=40576 RepID=UPI0023B27055|nr:AAA family ATPase [Xenorhabdus bovienii]MDE9494392.1 ATP-binding protein [Xenorhabdus bovienii]MDE9502831.1 ATP-binding protein [Xenorhabdus bovienii]MDE9526446.1 ATP-binding protein [Xenorhabdus bovienii]
MSKPSFQLGLTGAQGTGKTTLAKNLSERTGIRYFDADVRGIIKRNGFDCRAVMSPLECFKMQEVIAKELFNSYPDDNFVTDRTPVDVVSYALAYVPPYLVEGSDLENEISCALIGLISEARKALIKKFSHVVLVRGGFLTSGKDAKRVDRGSMSLAYRLKIESLMEGEFFRFANFTDMGGIEWRCMPRDLTDLNKRQDSLIGLYGKTFDSFGYITDTAH